MTLMVMPSMGMGVLSCACIDVYKRQVNDRVVMLDESAEIQRVSRDALDRPGSMGSSFGLSFRMSSFFVNALGCLTFRERVIW